MSDGSSEAWQSPDFDDSIEDRGAAMVKASMAIEQTADEGLRADQNMMMARMYEAQPITSAYAYMGKYFGSNTTTYPTWSFEDSSTWNVARSVVGTAAAMIGRSRPRARWITEGGNYKQKKRAKDATSFCDGWAQEEDLYATTFKMLIDSLVMDFGVVQLVDCGDKVAIERCLPGEIKVDPIDGLMGCPRTIYRTRFYSKAMAKQKFGKGKPKIREAIDGAETVDPRGLDGQSDMIRIHEAWHLASEDGADDGLHIIAIETTVAEGQTLFAEKWTHDWFPLVFLRWEDALFGFHGRSLMSQLSNIQSTINTLIYRIDKALRLVAVPRLAIPRGAKLAKSSLSNLIAGSIDFSGPVAPTPLEWRAMGQEVYDWLEQQIQKAFDLPGISRNSASGVKDPATKSGAAIRESLDVQATRIQVYQQRWEAAHVEIYRKMILMVSAIVKDKRGGSYVVKAPMGKDSLRKIDFADIGIDMEESRVEVWPVSQMPLTPQGRLDYVNDMVTSGLWTLERAKQAMEDLDLDSANNLELSVARLMEKEFEEMLYDGVPSHPDELLAGTYDQVLKTAAQYYNMGRYEEAPAKHLDLLRRYMEELKELAAAVPANTNAPPAAAAAPPVAATA